MQTSGTIEGAVSLISGMMSWQANGSLDWDMTPGRLKVDPSGTLVTWMVTPGVGGPIEIDHRTFARVDTLELDELAEVARELVRVGQDAERRSAERAEYEEAMKRSAKSLLRRKAATGIRLVAVVSQPIPTDWAHEVGAEVILDVGDAGNARRVTIETDGEADLKTAFEKLLRELSSKVVRAAA